MGATRIASIFIISTLIIAGLYLGKNILIPLILATIIWFIIREIRQLIRKVPFFRAYFPSWLENLIASITLFAIISVVLGVIVSNIQTLSIKLPYYQSNVEQILIQIEELFQLDLQQDLKTLGATMDLSKLVSIAFTMVSNLFGNIFIVLIYILFMLIEESGFHHKLRAIYQVTAERKKILGILNKIDHSIGKYLLLKTFVSVLTGVLSFIILLVFGIETPFFWAFLIFVLNYIPTIGSLVATLFPTLFALLQFGDWYPAIWILLLVGMVQMIVGNYIEPLVMGNSLNISSLVVILALSFWGALWGITGMLLSVPITVILAILFAEFPSTRNIALMLSEKGNLKR